MVKESPQESQDPGIQEKQSINLTEFKLLSMDKKTFIVVLVISLAALALVSGINVRYWNFQWMREINRIVNIRSWFEQEDESLIPDPEEREDRQRKRRERREDRRERDDSSKIEIRFHEVETNGKD